MNKDSRIYIAGHKGLVGSAINRKLKAEGYTNLITRSHQELDLMRQDDVQAFFESERPEYVFLAAAKVGGILANNTYPAEFIYSNIMIQANVIHAAYRAAVKKLLFLGSSCIYPRDCPQPMREEYLLSGKPIVATKIPSHTQVLNDEVAVLVAPTKEALAAGISNLIQAPNLRAQVGRQAHSFANEYCDPAKYSTKLDQAYQAFQRSS